MTALKDVKKLLKDKSGFVVLVQVWCQISLQI